MVPESRGRAVLVSPCRVHPLSCRAVILYHWQAAADEAARCKAAVKQGGTAILSPLEQCVPRAFFIARKRKGEWLDVYKRQLLESDLLAIMRATTDGTLDQVEVKFSNQSAACVVLASGGYPQHYEKGKVITGLENGQLPGGEAVVYHAGTALKDGQLVTAGGRVLGVTATADTLKEALEKAYAASEQIHFDGLHKRTDIGARALAAL